MSCYNFPLTVTSLYSNIVKWLYYGGKAKADMLEAVKASITASETSIKMESKVDMAKEIQALEAKLGKEIHALEKEIHASGEDIHASEDRTLEQMRNLK